MQISPTSAVAEITATNAEHFGWNRHTMQAVDKCLSTFGGFGYVPREHERAAVRAWLTATDERIGLSAHASDGDPMGYALVAAEVCALDDDPLLGLYQERRRETREHRYQVRPVAEMAEDERERNAEGFTAAAARFIPQPEARPGDVGRGELYAAAGRGMAAGAGFVLWDRINHMYVVAQWFADADGAAAECARLNERHTRVYEPAMWS